MKECRQDDQEFKASLGHIVAPPFIRNDVRDYHRRGKALPIFPELTVIAAGTLDWQNAWKGGIRGYTKE